MSRFATIRPALQRDAVAALVLGIQSVPAGLANGLLAGVNPLAGLYAYLVGPAAGALVTSSAFMAVQGTGAMAVVIADIPEVQNALDPGLALFTLAVVTGVIMLVVGLLRLGSIMRFVSNAVMVGFINAVGVNIVLGQLADLTGYAADGPNRIARAVGTFLSPAQLHLPSILVGLLTIALIVLIGRTRLGAMSLVVAVVAASAIPVALGWSGVATIDDLGVATGSLPLPVMPDPSLIPALLLPAISLAFVGLIQGASISASFPNPDGRYPDTSRDFTGQGVANVAAGVFQGMPVGGSLSATAILKHAGAASRLALLLTSLVMAVVIVVFGDVVGSLAMPSLAGLLIVVGFRTVSPADLRSVWRTGPIQKVIVATTFALTLLIPMQYAVLVGVGLSIILHVVRQSNQVTMKRWELDEQGHVTESEPPGRLPAGEVIILQPYGSLFFAAAPMLETLLPSPDATSRGSVVIVRVRGRVELGVTFLALLRRYAASLAAVGSRLVIVSTNERVEEQLRVAGITALIGSENVYAGDERVGAALRRAHADAAAWVRSQAAASAEDGGDTDGGR